MAEKRNVNPVTTHVLDTADGNPAHGLHLRIEKARNPTDSEFEWETINSLETNHDGRTSSHLWPDHLPFEAGVYRVVFDTQAYFEKSGRTTFYPYVEVVFRIADPWQHYHVPLLISPYGYSTYRGS